MPRKFNVAISGSRDDFAHTHINDIGLQPAMHATTGKMGFNVVLGGYMSSKRVAESIDMDLWVPDEVDATVELTRAILRIFRDEGERKDRQKGRLMWLVEKHGQPKEVVAYPGEAPHLRCDPSYRDRIISEMASYGNGIDKLVDVQQPRPKGHFERRTLNGIFQQPQPGLNRVGIHVPSGRLSVVEARQVADLADKYVPGAEIRLTVEQNIILPNVKDEDIDALCAESALDRTKGSRLSINPGKIRGNLVSCTGAQFCGLAMIETKNNAERIADELEEIVEVPADVRIHWTGCPNSCGQVQAGDIGLMGGPAKKMNEEGKFKAVPGVLVFIGGSIGEHGKLQLEPTKMNGGEGSQGVPIEDLVPVLTQLIIDKFNGKIKPEFEAKQAAWQKAREKSDAELQAAEDAKKAKKAGQATRAEATSAVPRQAVVPAVAKATVPIVAPVGTRPLSTNNSSQLPAKEMRSEGASANDHVQVLSQPTCLVSQMLQRVQRLTETEIVSVFTQEQGNQGWRNEESAAYERTHNQQLQIARIKNDFIRKLELAGRLSMMRLETTGQSIAATGAREMSARAWEEPSSLTDESDIP